MADALLPEAAEEIFQEMTPYERDIVRVAGDSSNIWRIDDLGYALRSNHVQVLGGPALANFIRKRNHIFCFENGEVWTKFASIDSLPSSKVTNVRISDDLRKKLDKVITVLLYCFYFFIAVVLKVSIKYYILSDSENLEYEEHLLVTYFYVNWYIYRTI